MIPTGSKSKVDVSVPPARPEGLPFEKVPDWNNIGLFTAGILLGGVLGATVALLIAPGSGEETRGRLSSRFGREGDDDEDGLWDELAAELERAAAERGEVPTVIVAES